MRWMMVCVFGAMGCAASNTVIRIEQDAIQQRLDARFPVEKTRLLTKVTLDHPVVVFQQGSDRIGLKLNVTVAPPSPIQAVRGQGQITGLLSYTATEGAFYFQEPRVDNLTIDGKTPEEAKALRAPVEWVTGTVLAVHPVYTLDRTDYKELAASLVLRDVRVQEGALEVEMGVGR